MPKINTYASKLNSYLLSNNVLNLLEKKNWENIHKNLNLHAVYKQNKNTYLDRKE